MKNNTLKVIVFLKFHVATKDYHEQFYKLHRLDLYAYYNAMQYLLI